MSTSIEAVTIDHSAFPHILKTILQFASLDVIRTFRATCRAYRDECGVRLFAHASLGRQFVVKLPSDSAWGSLDIRLRSMQSARLLDLSLYPLPAETWQRNATRFASMKAYAGVRTVRVISDDNQEAFFRSEPSLSPWRVVFLNVDCPFLQLSRGRDLVLPSTVQRLIVHVLLQESPFKLATPPALGGVHLVVIVGACRPYRSEAFPCEPFAEMISGLTCETVTMVGLPEYYRIKVSLALIKLSFAKLTGNGPGSFHTIQFISRDEFERTSPHFGIETDKDYRLTQEEVDVLACGSESAIRAKGL